jgi:ceramide glucosyltransferase
MLMLLLQAACALTAVGGIVYCCFALWAVMKFRHKNRDDFGSKSAPPVSVIKPLCGVDPHAYESLRSHCIQGYPNYEIIFGVSNPDEPVVRLVEQLKTEFPEIPIGLVVCSRLSGMNFKVSNILQMLPMARHEYLVINDSDIAVPSDYLRRVVAPLENADVGMVTCLYRGMPGDSIGSKLEALGISADFTPGVLCANQLWNGLRFAMGSTLAFHRRTLNVIGGFEALADYLADDYELGRRTSEAGFQVELADCVVEHYLPDYSLAAFFEHQLRWARTIRSSRPEGYAGLIFTYAIPWSFFSLLVTRGARWAWVLLLTAFVLRFAVTCICGSLVLHDRRVRHLWLLPVRDFVALLVWVGGYMGRQVVWRGRKFRLAGGKLRPLVDVTTGNSQ